MVEEEALLTLLEVEEGEEVMLTLLEVEERAEGKGESGESRREPQRGARGDR